MYSAIHIIPVLRYVTHYIGLLLFYTIATVFQLYHGGNIMYEMRRRNPEPTQGIINNPTPYRHGMRGLAFDDAVSYAQHGIWIAARLNVSHD